MPGGRVCKISVLAKCIFLCSTSLSSTSSFARSGIRHKYNATAAQMLLNFSHQPSLKWRFILFQLVKILFSWRGTGASASAADALRFGGWQAKVWVMFRCKEHMVKYPEWKDLRYNFPSTPENLLSEVREMIHAMNSHYNGRCVTSPCDLVNPSWSDSFTSPLVCRCLMTNIVYVWRRLEGPWLNVSDKWRAHYS